MNEFIDGLSWGVIGMGLVQILLYIYVAKFKAYVVKKTENQATKEDVGEITNIVEEAKKIHTKEIDNLRSQLDVSAQQKKIIFEDGKKALYEFYTLINNWFLKEDKADYDFVYESNDYTLVQDRVLDVTKYAKKVYVQKNMIELLIVNKELIDTLIHTYEAFMYQYNGIVRHFGIVEGLLCQIQEYVEEQHYPSGKPEFKDIDELYGELKNITAPQKIGECRKEQIDYNSQLKIRFEKLKTVSAAYLHQQ
ncbi:MAG: hypothetical protein N4A71_00385 [Carboxylicivirga sp.]|jgi:Na+-transporting methylmalonyl-CoA/oxaloacetate decarboxylase gamma subunit|nr:hypothetical protein [Carboxylicivirga sp.]